MTRSALPGRSLFRSSSSFGRTRCPLALMLIVVVIVARLSHAGEIKHERSQLPVELMTAELNGTTFSCPTFAKVTLCAIATEC